jgi:CBS domain-containing protein
MNRILTAPAPPLVLHAETAADLMTSNPISVRDTATLHDAIGFLSDRRLSAAPVVDTAGRAVGVLSRTDVLRRDRAHLEHPDLEAEDRPHTHDGEFLPRGFQVERVDRTLVRDVMTPVVLSVAPETPAGLVARQMVTLKVHRLFVIDHQGILVGVVSATDVLRGLQPKRNG